jgi:hypothetical protein
MKTPFEGEFKIVPTDLPEPLKQEFLQANSPKYIWVALPEPIQQRGHDFSFAVLPVKLTSDLALEQSGRGVLCQTEAEAKESMELLSQREKTPIVLIESAGFGMVGKVSNYRAITTEIGAYSRPVPNGGREWWAWEREIDKATGEIKVLRRQDASSEVEATQIAQKWQQEYNEKKNRCDNAAAKSKIPAPPAHCLELTPSEIKDDLPAAKWAALKRQWPHSFAIFEKRKANPNIPVSDQECQDAYLLDLAEQGHKPHANTIRGDTKLRSALAKAAKNFARRGKSKVTDLAIYLIAFNWELGWCYLSNAELAEKLCEKLQISFTPEQVEKYRYRTLGLVAKHLPGPPQKSS